DLVPPLQHQPRIRQKLPFHSESAHHIRGLTLSNECPILQRSQRIQIRCPLPPNRPPQPRRRRLFIQQFFNQLPHLFPPQRPLTIANPQRRRHHVQLVHRRCRNSR